MRPKSTFYASDNLRRLYRERAGELTQAQFARRHKIGGQSMLAQILSGAKALPIETAPKLAKALRCTIDEMCPEMAEFIRDELMPALGKALRRAAMVLLSIGLFQFAPSDAYASSIYHNALPNYTLGDWLRHLACKLLAWCGLAHKPAFNSTP